MSARFPLHSLQSHAPLTGAVLVGALLAGCGATFGDGHSGATPAAMRVEEISNGFGQLIPHRIRELGSDGQPTQQIVSVRSFDDLVANLTSQNLLLPVTQFEETELLPSGVPGNHFMYARFTQPIDMMTILDNTPGGQSNSGLTGALSVTAIDPISGDSLPIQGRAFVNGETFALPIVTNPISGTPELTRQAWVENVGTGEFARPQAIDLDEDGDLTNEPGWGFPGTQGTFEGANDLISPNTVVFVVDTDGNLDTHEGFPADVQIRMKVTTAVRSTEGVQLVETALGSSTVGADELGPEVRVTPPPLNEPLIFPMEGAINVDPLTNLRIEFTEPVQPLFVGDLDDGSPPTLSSSILVQFGPPALRTTVPFSVRPVSIFDLSTFELIPAFNFPGAGPSSAECGTFNEIQITINPGQVIDLSSDPDNPNPNGANLNLLGGQSSFTTGEGPGLVNAPVTPDVIYMGRTGGEPGLSVIDLNGFGQSTGNPFYDPTGQSYQEGWTNFPNNPNVKFQGALLRPPLAPGTCTIDGGSAGVFTLTRDSSLNDKVVRAPFLTSIQDMSIGHSLDSSFNNSPFPFGCQSGGGSLCTLDGLKVVQPVFQGAGEVITPAQVNQFGAVVPGSENLVSWAPHPNPPPLQFPPLCVSPFLGGLEPTSVDVGPGSLNPANILPNLLAPGDPFGDPLGTGGVVQPPSGLLTPEQNNYFEGPSLPQATINACGAFQMRQQIGQYLYIADRQRNEVVVLNSNRMAIIDRITVPDPTALATGTNADFIAISNQQANTVTFVDINPNSATFHQVVKVVVVGDSPRGIAWETGNEDVLVCNENSSSVSLISVFSFEVRKEVDSQLNRPFDVVTTPRQLGPAHGFLRGVYFGYVVNRTGVIGFFESGPNTINGWGYDNVVGVAPMNFANPKTLQPDHLNTDSGCWIVHEGPIDVASQSEIPSTEGAVSNLVIQSALVGQIPLSINSFLIPGLRDIALGVNASLAGDKLTGIPVDVAFDNMRNKAGLQNLHTSFAPGSPSPVNGRNLVRYLLGATWATNVPRFMFVAVPNAPGSSGVVDVIEISAGGFPLTDVNAFQAGTQSVPAPNVLVLCDYFRQ